MNTELRKLDKNNFEDFFKILNAMHLWAHGSEMEKGSRERLKEHYFIENPKYECLVAYAESEAVGFISFYETYATMDARVTMYIEDLFILDEYRHKGIGKALVSGCLDIAKKKNYSRVDLLSFGEGPRKFYEKIGAEWKDHNYHYRLSEDIIKEGLK